MNVLCPYIRIGVSWGPVPSISLGCLGRPLSQGAAAQENGFQSLQGGPGRSLQRARGVGLQAGQHGPGLCLLTGRDHSQPPGHPPWLLWNGPPFGGTLAGCPFVLPVEVPCFMKRLYNPLQEGPAWLLL